MNKNVLRHMRLDFKTNIWPRTTYKMINCLTCVQKGVISVAAIARCHYLLLLVSCILNALTGHNGDMTMVAVAVVLLLELACRF